MWDRRKKRKLEARRLEALSAIRGERSKFDTMAARAKINGLAPEEFAAEVRERLNEFERKAGEVITEGELEDLVDDAEWQGQLRAYLCPPAEIADEGRLALDVMEEWGVPGATVNKLRESLGRHVADMNEGIARSSLRAIFEEFDSWWSYVDDYQKTMSRSAKVLMSLIAGLSFLAIALLHFPRTLLLGLLLAGAAGASGSVILKMPSLEVSPSGELEAYPRRVRSRIGVGVIASLIGCALLGWGLLPIAIQNQTFADVLGACTTTVADSCTEGRILILLGVPMLLGFSERALTSFEDRLLGKWANSKAGA